MLGVVTLVKRTVRQSRATLRGANVRVRMSHHQSKHDVMDSKSRGLLLHSPSLPQWRCLLEYHSVSRLLAPNRIWYLVFALFVRSPSDLLCLGVDLRKAGYRSASVAVFSRVAGFCQPRTSHGVWNDDFEYLG